MFANQAGGFGAGASMGIGALSSVQMNASKAATPMTPSIERSGQAGRGMIASAPPVFRPRPAITPKPSAGMGPMTHGSAMPPILTNFGF